MRKLHKTGKGKWRCLFIFAGCDYCNVSFYLEMDSDYVISKSEDHLAPLFLHFCKKYDICNLN